MRTHLIALYVLCALLLVLGLVFHNGFAFGLGLIGTLAYGGYILNGQPKVQYSPEPVQARPLTPSQPHVAIARPLSIPSRKPPRNGRLDP